MSNTTERCEEWAHRWNWDVCVRCGATKGYPTEDWEQRFDALIASLPKRVGETPENVIKPFIRSLLSQRDTALVEDLEKSEIKEIEEHQMTPFEQNLAQAILSALEYRGFYDCGKYLDTSLIEHIRPLLEREKTTLIEALEVKKLMHPLGARMENDYQEGRLDGYIQGLSDAQALIRNEEKSV